MGKFDNAAAVESLVWEMRLANFSRGGKRALINDLFGGVAPYTESQQEENNLSVNFNDNTAVVAAHGARRQLMAAIQKPKNFFTVTVDRGPVWKRQQWGSIITKYLNKPLKRSLPYYEDLRSTIANVVLHGIGPSVWQDRECWRPHARGVEDMLIPSNTLLSMENLSMFAVFEPMTAMQLHQLTSGPRVDPAWNMPLVNKLIADAEEQVMEYGIPFSETYSPEKLAQRRKEDSGLYAADSLATIDTISFYYWNDDKKQAGWNKRIILDATWSQSYLSKGNTRANIKNLTSASRSRINEKNQFLYNPGSRKYADKLSQLVHFQFGDLSATAPFRYHSIRSLGWLLYAPCHIQNRLHCAFLDSVFEQLMQYYRVKTLDDYQRALKVDLVNKGYIDESINFVKPEERWQVNQPLVAFALQHHEGMIGQHSNIFSSKPQDNKSGVEKKELEIMAQIHSETALIGAALAQAYVYQEAQFQETCRRFTKKNSKDPDVREFRNNCLRGTGNNDGVPEEILNDVGCWEVAAERIMGAGNKTLETAIANQLMAWRPTFDPEPQRDILRASVLAITDDAAMADRLVPENEHRISNSIHDAQLSAGALMMGLQVDLKTGENHIEAVETLLHEFGIILKKIMDRGGIPTPDEMMGMQNLGAYIGKHIQVIAQDKNEKQRVKQYADDLGNIMNEVKAMGQRLAEKMKAEQQQQGPQIDPKDKVKVAGMILQAKTKAELARMSHAERSAARHTQEEMAMQRDAEKHALDLRKKASEAALDLGVKAQEVALQKERNRLKAFSE